jgi:superfamily II DNA or RNA helicase
MNLPVVCKNGMVVKKTKEALALKKELTVRPSNSYLEKSGIWVKSYPVYRETKTDIIIPTAFGIKKFDEYCIKYPRIKYTDIPNCTATPRPHQLEALECLNKIFEEPVGGGILNLMTGYGKTFTTIKLISMKKLKTIVVLNKIELMNQWKTELERFIPGIKIGYIQGKTYDVENKHVVLSMLQTVSQKQELTVNHFSDFSLLVIDEVHHISSEVFSNLFWKCNPRYKLGLSATLERADKLEKVFYWHLGDVLYSNVGKSKKQQTEIVYKEYKSGKFTTEESMARLINMICEDTNRTEMIAETVNNIAEDKQRKILVLSDRIQHLQNLRRLINNSSLYIGGMKNEELKISKSSQVLLATYHMCSEGFDFPELNTLILATPRSNIIQTIGRIYRKHHDITPLIVDVIDTSIYQFKNQANKRKKCYHSEIMQTRDEREEPISLQPLFI